MTTLNLTKALIFALLVVVLGYGIISAMSSPSDVRQENCESAPAAFDYC